MARGAVDDVDADGEFAAGIGIAIATFIAVFVAGIAVFVIGQERPLPASPTHEVGSATTTALPANPSSAVRR